jgi:alpha-ketoglutarate-dependent taurine dioxygenase
MTLLYSLRAFWSSAFPRASLRFATSETLSRSKCVGIKLGSINPSQTRFLSSEVSVGNDHPILSLPSSFLREMDKNNFDPVTHQRRNVAYDIHSGKPILHCDKKTHQIHKITDCSFDSTTDSYQIIWDDGHTTEYSSKWVEGELSKWRGGDVNAYLNLWMGLTEDKVRNSSICLDFEELVMTDEGMCQALLSLYQYGILLVTNTPTDDDGSGVAALTAGLGGGSRKRGNPTSLVSEYRTNTKDAPIILPHGTDGPLRTLYGTVWSTASSGQAEGASVADSAYGQEGLPLHTDMTYMQDPPGLQIFTMVQPAIKGGESVFGDGFAIAERLRTIDPVAFDTLSQTMRRYRCIDDCTGWHLEAHGPIISLRNGQVVGIRHNDLDRLADLPPLGSANENEEFYDRLTHAHCVWDELLALDEFRLVMKLQPGDTIVVANQVGQLSRSQSLFTSEELLVGLI